MYAMSTSMIKICMKMYNNIVKHDVTLHVEYLHFKSIEKYNSRDYILTFTTLKYVCINHGDQRVFFNLKS